MMHFHNFIPLPWRLLNFLEQTCLHSWPWEQGPDEIAPFQGPVDIRLIAFGDVLLNRALQLTPALIFGPLLPIIQSVDLRTCNLEGPLTYRTTPAGSIGSFLRTDPSAIELLQRAGMDVVNVANNHMLDYGREGFNETLGHLQRTGIQSCGVWSGADTIPTITTIRGLRIAFLGFCDDYYPAGNGESAARPALISDGNLTETVRLAKAQVDLLIVHLHWGYEFSLHPLLDYRNTARRIVESGADLVLCHHAHVNQGIERWRHGAIAYGLGNAIMPQSDYMRSGHAWTSRSFALEAGLGRDGICFLRVHPFAIGADGRLRTLDTNKRHQLLVGLKRTSLRLHNDALLSRIECSSIVAQTLSLIAALQQDAQTGDGLLRERARTLSLPRQQRLAAYLSTLGSPVGSALQEIAIAMDDQDLRAVYNRLGATLSNATVSLLPHFSPWATFRSRVP